MWSCRHSSPASRQIHPGHISDANQSAGKSDATDYPLQKKRHTLEFLRSIAHMRARTNTISAMARVRSALSAATNTFFKQHGFLQVHTPIISASDCEGAGEMFQVRTHIALPLLTLLSRSS